MTNPKTLQAMKYISNDELRDEFMKIYGRPPSSLFELEQFRKNRPVRYYEPARRGKTEERDAAIDSLPSEEPKAPLEICPESPDP